MITLQHGYFLYKVYAYPLWIHCCFEDFWDSFKQWWGMYKIWLRFAL